MSKGRKRLKHQQEQEAKVLADVKAHKGLSKYQRKEMARRKAEYSLLGSNQNLARFIS